MVCKVKNGSIHNISVSSCTNTQEEGLRGADQLATHSLPPSGVGWSGGGVEVGWREGRQIR